MTLQDITVRLTALIGSTPDPTPSPTIENPVDLARDACDDGATICDVVTRVTGSQSAGEWTQVVIGTPLQILLILAVGFVLRKLFHRAVDRVVRKIVDGDTSAGRSRRHGRTAAVLPGGALSSERRVQRARTMGSVLRSVSTGVIAVVVLLMVLAEVGLNVAPLLAGAGILGVALGFGSQTLVKDFLSGVFLIVEDQYGVGDVVDLGDADGTVEAVGLRVTRLRDVNGTVWYVRNGEIVRVGNKSQGWARAVLDVDVAYGEDIGRVQDLLRRVGADLYADEAWKPLIMEAPEVWGVEALSADAVVVRLVVKTQPLQQWVVARELRRRIKTVFDEAGVEIPFSQRTVWLRDSRGTEPTPAASATAVTTLGSEPPPPSESAVATDIEPDEEQTHP